MLQSEILNPSSSSLLSPGSMRNRGSRNSKAKSRSLAEPACWGGSVSCCCCCCCCHHRFRPLGMTYASDWTSFFTFWILLWNFFLLVLFLGQCNPDIWFTVNSIDCIRLSQEMEKLLFLSFYLLVDNPVLALGWPSSANALDSQGRGFLCLHGWKVTQGRKWAKDHQLKGVLPLPPIQVFPPK